MSTDLLTSRNVALDDAIDHFDSLSSMARALGLSGYQVIQDWCKRGVVPAEHCPKVEKITGVRCERLNPRIDWGYLRGTSLHSDETESR